MFSREGVFSMVGDRLRESHEVFFGSGAIFSATCDMMMMMEKTPLQYQYDIESRRIGIGRRHADTVRFCTTLICFRRKNFSKTAGSSSFTKSVFNTFQPLHAEHLELDDAYQDKRK
jgi:hypothetical protein